MSDTDILSTALAGNYTDTIGPDGKQMVTPLVSATQTVKRRSHTFQLNDLATAGTAITESVVALCDAPNGWKIISVSVAAPIAVAASDADFVTFTLSKRTGAGAATVMATQTTKITGGSNGLVAFVPVALVNSATPANLLTAANDVITVLASKTGAGKAITAATSLATIHVVYEEK